MPELPEVEVIKILLDQEVSGASIKNVDIYYSKLRVEIPDNFAKLVCNHRISKCERRGRYLLLHLTNKITIVIHLGMSGKILIKSDLVSAKKHDHLIMKLSNNKFLVFNDARRFGLITLLPLNSSLNNILSNLGPEPLLENFSSEYLRYSFQKKTGMVKNCLMDNKIVVGVGNIYANESLFISKIHPNRTACSLSVSEIERLVVAIKQVLKNAIEKGGSTLKDFVDLAGSSGSFQKHFTVYGREGKECIVCAGKILRIKQAGRSTFLCPNCQKLDYNYN